MSKFRRNRSVDPGWLNTPIKYCSEVKGKYTNQSFEIKQLFNYSETLIKLLSRIFHIYLKFYNTKVITSEIVYLQ